MSNCYHADVGQLPCTDEEGNPEVCSGPPIEEPPYDCWDCDDTGRDRHTGKRCHCNAPRLVRWARDTALRLRLRKLNPKSRFDDEPPF